MRWAAGTDPRLEADAELLARSHDRRARLSGTARDVDQQRQQVLRARCVGVRRYEEVGHVLVDRLGLVDAEQLLGRRRDRADRQRRVDDEKRLAAAGGEVDRRLQDEAQAAVPADTRWLGVLDRVGRLRAVPAERDVLEAALVDLDAAQGAQSPHACASRRSGPSSTDSAATSDTRGRWRSSISASS